MPTCYHVYGALGSGSAIVELLLARAGLQYETVDASPWGDATERARLRAINPLGQVPTVTTPTGTVLTESAAIALHLNDVVPAARLLPPVGDPQRDKALRWLVFLVAAIYPTFTFGDEPSRWVETSAASGLRARTDRWCQSLWKMVEAEAGDPWFLGRELSAIDLFLAVMVEWRPRRAWFEEHCPRLAEISARVGTDPALAAILDRHRAAAAAPLPGA